MIEVHQHPDETVHTARGCPWVAECEVAGIIHTVRSRSGAPYALARILVEAGIADQPMVVIAQGIAGETRYRSFHQIAGYTIQESSTVPIHRNRWEPYTGIRRDTFIDPDKDTEHEDP
jgi:hypothetical protein